MIKGGRERELKRECLMNCKNCNYFAQTESEEWKGVEHCCFHEWGHTDDELAPCDYEEYDYDFDYEKEI